MGRKMTIPHVWRITASKTPLVSMQHGFKHSCSVRRRQSCRTRYFHTLNYQWDAFWAMNERERTDVLNVSIGLGVHSYMCACAAHVRHFVYSAELVVL